MTSRWSREGDWLVGSGFAATDRAPGHEVTLDLPVLAPALRLFTTGDRGVVDLSLLPPRQPVPMVSMAGAVSRTATAYVLPLASVFDVGKDCAWTVGYPPDRTFHHSGGDGSKDARPALHAGHPRFGQQQALPLAPPCSPPTRPIPAASLTAYAARSPPTGRPCRPTATTALYSAICRLRPDFSKWCVQKYLPSVLLLVHHWATTCPDGPDSYPYTYAKWWNLRGDHERRPHQRLHQRNAPAPRPNLRLLRRAPETRRQWRPERRPPGHRLFGNASPMPSCGCLERPHPHSGGALAMDPGLGYSLWPRLEGECRAPTSGGTSLPGSCRRSPRLGRHPRLRADDGLDGGQPARWRTWPDRSPPPCGECASFKVVRRASTCSSTRPWKVEMLRDISGSCHESAPRPAAYPPPPGHRRGRPRCPVTRATSPP